MAWGGGNGPFDVLYSDVYGEQFEKACIYSNTETDGITHTLAQPQCGNTCEDVRTHSVWWHICAHPHPGESVRTPKPSSERRENAQQQTRTHEYKS